MQQVDQLIRTKLRLPFTRSGIVPRPRLQEQIVQGLHYPLTLITAPAGFGKTTLVASYIVDCGMSHEPPVRVAWLSLDQDDNQDERFLSYLIAALQAVDQTIGREAAEILAGQQSKAAPVLTSLINDLDIAEREIALVLDDYHFISNQAVHEQVAFLLEHCPKTFHLVIVTRSDPPLPLHRLRARGQMVEFRAADLRFTPAEAAQFLNDVVGLGLDARSITVLSERTEGWIAGLQMASIALQSHLSSRDRTDISLFIEGFSGTNRYILDYLLEEVLAGQPPEIQHFLLFTSILERITAPLCDALMKVEMVDGWGMDQIPANAQSSNQRDCQAILEYLERANLFLIPLDDDASGAGARTWYRYHHLFADLLRTQLQKSLGDHGVTQLHLRASAWYEQNNSTLDAIYHASLASDFERIEHLIEQNYTNMMNHGEMSWVRFWMGKLSKELILRRPWLCLYEAGNRAWFGQLEEAELWLNEAKKRIWSEVEPRSEVELRREVLTRSGAADTAGVLPDDTQAMLGYHAYLKSRVTAMQGDTRSAITLCRTAREYIPEGNLGLQIDFNITLGYEYFLSGDFANAEKTLSEMVQLGTNARAINNPVAGYAILARMRSYQGQLQESYHLLERAAQLIHDANGQYLGVNGLLEVETAALLYEWNDLESALIHIKQGLDLLSLWGKADDFALAYVTLSKIQLAQGNRTDAVTAVNKAVNFIHNCGVFSEARITVEAAQVRMWLAESNWLAVDRWAAALEKRLGPRDPIQFEDELILITRARVLIEQNRPDDAIQLLARLEETARAGGRIGRLIEILILRMLALQKTGDTAQADEALIECLAVAEPEGYLRIFLDTGQPMQIMLAKILSQAATGALWNYVTRLLSQYDARPRVQPGQANPVLKKEKGAEPASLIDPLSHRELEVLNFIAQGKTNQEIALKLVLSLGTVKAHAASIYRKLDVANRTEAVARARQLGILP